jgi:hypothetical protein
MGDIGWLVLFGLLSTAPLFSIAIGLAWLFQLGKRMKRLTGWLAIGVFTYLLIWGLILAG